jgi:hypothetical protein
MRDGWAVLQPTLTWMELLFACAILGETVGTQWTWVPKLAVTLLRQMQLKLSVAVGRPLTEYRFRPGCDALARRRSRCGR